MTTVLVTGGAGYIGSHVCKAMSAAGLQPVVLDNLSTGHREFCRWGPFVHGDVRDRSAVRDALVMYRPAAVIHLAALSRVADSVARPGRYYEINVGGMLSLLSEMSALGVGNLVLSSSAAVYDAVSPYGATKLFCERMLRDFEASDGVRSVVLRYFNAAGADRDGEIGEDHAPETHLIPLALDVALGRRQLLTVFGHDYATADGTAERDYVHVADLARAHLLATDRLCRGGRSVSCDLGTGRGATVRQVLAEVEAVTGSRILVDPAERRAGDPDSLVADPTYARAELGWKAEHGLREIVEDAWRWHSARFRDKPLQ